MAGFSARLRYARAPTAPYELVMWGDSLTAGTGATGLETRWTTLLARSYHPDRHFVNFGIGGETSTQIATRMLADTAYKAATTIIWAGRNNYTDPTTVKADIAAMVASLTTTRFLVLSVLNGNYASEYSGQSGYNTIVQLNTDLAAVYGTSFLDIRTPLVASYDAGTPQDVTDFGRDIPPSTKRFDEIHQDDDGHAFTFGLVKPVLLARGW